MPIYEFGQDSIVQIVETTFAKAGQYERRDLQRLLRKQPEVIHPDILIISEEFSEWEDSKRRIDLLGIDRDAKLVVIELKRTEDGGHMEMQAIRYAAMVSTMTFDQVTTAFERYLTRDKKDSQYARRTILHHLEWVEPDDQSFAQDVRIILVSADFSKELTASVIWLNKNGLDIKCIRLKPHEFEGRIVVDVQQIIPLPELKDVEAKFREKAEKERDARTSGKDNTKFDVWIDGKVNESLSKKAAIILICKVICEKGVDPNNDKLRQFIKAYEVVGAVDSAAEFKRIASEQQLSLGLNKFDPERWYCRDGELVQANGKTYAFFNQWPRDKWLKAMNFLKEEFSSFKIDFKPEADR